MWRRSGLIMRIGDDVELHAAARPDGVVAHEVVFADCWMVRILPDHRPRAERQSQIVADLETADAMLPDAVAKRIWLVGCLALTGFAWELVDLNPSPHDVVEAWMDAARDADEFIAELRAAGWEIVRREDA